MRVADQRVQWFTVPRFLTILTRAALMAFGYGLAMVASVASAAQPDAAYLDGGASAFGVILLHGRHGGRGHAKSPVVNPLRIALHERLGFHTLSLNYPQTPGSRSAEEELVHFPAVYQQINAAIAFLTQEKGVTHIYLMGHSLGALISTSYLAKNSASAIKGYIGVGIVGGARNCPEADITPLHSLCNLETMLRNNAQFPVIDVVAAGDPADVHFANRRKQLISPAYQQVRVGNADHNFTSNEKENEMVSIVVDWLRERK